MDFRKILKGIIYTGMFLVPFVPYYVASGLFFPFITGKAFFFRIVVEIIFGSWLALTLLDKSFRSKKNLLFYSLNIFVIVIALADILGGHFLKSFWSNFERMEGLVTFLHLLAYFYVLTSFIKTEKVWDRLLQTSIGVSLIVGGWGFLQLFGKFTSVQSGNRLDASFGNASYLAIYMLFHVFITTYLFTKHQGSKWVKWVYGLIIAFQTYILIFTQTRGTILALFGGTFLTFLLIAIFEKEKVKLKKVSIGILLGLVVLAGGFFLAKDTKLVQGIDPLRRIASISLTERTTASRFLIWNMAYEGFKEKPILGWGQENFVFVFEKYYDPRMYAQEPWFDRAHNVFFDWLIAGGLLGIISYLAIFLLAIVSTWKSIKFTTVQKSLFTGLLAGYFFHNLFVFDNIASYILFIIVLSLIHFNSREEEEVQTPLQASDFVYAKAIMPIILIAVIFSVYFFNIKGILTANTLLQALVPQERGIEENLELYKKALAYDTYGNQEIREQLLNATPSVLSFNVSPEIKEEFLNISRSEMQKQIDSNPDSARSNIFMGSFLNSIRLYDDAIPYLERGLELSPKKQPTYFEFVVNYLNNGDHQKALEFAKAAYELEPNFNDARIIYASALIYTNDLKDAQDLLVERFENEFYGDSRLARAYLDTENFNEAISTWQEILKENPNDIQTRIFLASTYLSAGLRAEAIEELRRAIEIDPNFKDQGEFFIQEIQAGRNP